MIREDRESNPNRELKETPTPIVAQWKYLPVPDDELDRHSEYYCKSGTSPEGLKLIGARVRGKMHKHNGTNCDDWFDFAVSGNWTIIAVSDGAGSQKFSRVGAKVSCEAAVNYLGDCLKKHKIKYRSTGAELSADLNRYPITWALVGEDIDSVQNSLHQAIQTAYAAVKQEAENRQNQDDCLPAIDGKIELNINDLSATLLLAVHTTILYEKTTCSLVLTCQVGDGMMAAISQKGTLQLLGKPDSGDYAGQTYFLTSPNQIESDNLKQKTFVFLGQLKALMVMTDGVADDYFPHDPKMLELYGDLILNQGISMPKPGEKEIAEELEKTCLRNISGIKEVQPNFQKKEQTLTEDGTKEIHISYLAEYAKELKKSVSEVIASPALLWAGSGGELMWEECPKIKSEEKLQIWLDSYYHRGSFDDRTLVILYREEV